MECVNLLVSDLDYTLLGNDEYLDKFAEWHKGARQRWRIAYSSGRFVNSVRESIRSTNLPEPDAIIGGVGTQIYCRGSGLFRDSWPQNLNDWDPATVRAVLSAHRELEPQPEDLVSQYKISFYARQLSDAFLQHLTRQLAAAGQRAHIVYSSQRDLDVLPLGTNKGTAAAFLARHWAIDHQRVIVAGDSGNDLEMFRQGFRGIVVGNAQPELRALTDPSVYHADGCCAAGVLEGIRYWLRDG